MAKQVFRLVLPERRVVNAVVGRFNLCSQQEVAQLGQRARLFSALVELPARRREELGEAVKLTGEAFLESCGGASVAFGLARRDGHRLVEVTFLPPPSGTPNGRVSMPQDSSPSTEGKPGALRLAESKTAAARGMLDEFELAVDAQGLPTARLGQALSPAMRAPNETEVSVWSELLQAPTAEEALVVVHRWSRSLCIELGQVRSREQLGSHLDDAIAAENLAMLSLVISKTKNAIAIMDADGTIHWVNEAFVEMTGYAPHEALGKRFDELAFGPSSSTEAVRAFEQAIAHGHEWSDDVLQYRKDGRTFWAECNLTPVYNPDGELKRWVIINTDVTRRRLEEESLRKAKEAAEASSRAKSDFLANVSHEIRTPMNAIIGMTDLALATDLTPEQREYMTVVHDSAQSLLQLLNDVLDLSKIEAGKLELEEIEFNLADVIRETIRALGIKAHKKNLPIEISAPLDLPEFVRGDPVRLRQILFNLVDNAIKFTEVGSIRIAIEEQWRTDSEVGLHLAIEDTGIGIPRDRLERIFESFTQADASTTRRYGGTGLGLTITAELVQMMGGRIWVQSSTGSGTVFHVSLRFPLVQPESAQTRIAEQMQDVLRGKRTLLISPDTTSRNVLGEWLTSWNASITPADSLEAALGTIPARSSRDDTPFDLAIIDIQSLDQAHLLLESSSQLFERCDHSIAILSFDAPDMTHQCHQAGMHTCLLRPVSRNALSDAILSATNTSASLPRQASQAGSGDTPKGADATSRKSAAPKQDDRADLAATHAESQLEASSRPLRILVVDDHDANRILARKILQRRGHHCVEARSGREALEIWRAEPFDVIILDVQMPEMDGFDVLQQIRQREQRSGKHVPIVTLTAHAMKGDREKCIAAGADAYLPKPLEAKQLVQLVEQLTDSAPPTATDAQSANIAQFDRDFTNALERMDGDEALLAEQMSFFLNDGPALVEQIETAAAQHDARQLELAAHRLKGLLAAYDAEPAADLARSLEESARTGSSDQAVETLKKLEPHVVQLIAAMKDWLANRA